MLISTFTNTLLKSKVVYFNIIIQPKVTNSQQLYLFINNIYKGY